MDNINGYIVNEHTGTADIDFDVDAPADHNDYGPDPDVFEESDDRA